MEIVLEVEYLDGVIRRVCLTYDELSNFRSLMAVLLSLKPSKTIPMLFRSEISSVKLRREYARDELKLQDATQGSGLAE